MKIFFFTLLTSFYLSAFCQDLSVASLHPILTDLIEKIGAPHTSVISILKPGGDVHHFEPNPQDIAQLKRTRAIFASGKGLETYLPKLKDNLDPSISIIEVGKTIPSIKLDPSNEIFTCCPNHSTSGIDPHWWHSPDAVKRAIKVIHKEICRLAPQHETQFTANSQSLLQQIDSLRNWANQQFNNIPRSKRYLVTAHAAFGYFCKDFGFKSIPLMGLNRNADDLEPQYIQKTIQTIRDLNIKVIFPEDQANSKILEQIVQSTGVTLGDELIADGTSKSAHDFQTIFTKNVTHIVKAYQIK
jgi:zinc/manganese transport system substrate-binding protein